MSGAKLPSPTLFQRAAELRVRGASWDATAKEIGRAEKTVREWARTHARAWRQAVRTAERQLADEATAESVLTLRRQLRSDDEKTVREAAATLIKFATLRPKPAAKAKAKVGPGLSPQVATIAAFVGGLTDEESDALLRELRQAAGTAGSHPGPAAAGGGGPERAG